MFNEEDESEQILGWLEQEGALVWEGMAEDGDRILSVNADRLAELSPELYQAISDEMSQHLDFLYSLGYVNLELDESGEEKFSITKEGRDILDKYGFGVSDD